MINTTVIKKNNKNEIVTHMGVNNSWLELSGGNA